MEDEQKKQELEVPEGIELIEAGAPEEAAPEPAPLYQEIDSPEQMAADATAAEREEEQVLPEELDPDAEELAALEAEIAAEEQAAAGAGGYTVDPSASPLESSSLADWDLAVLFDDMLVEQVEAPETIKAGSLDLKLADSYKARHRPLEAIVLLVGEGFPRKDGSIRPMQIKPGDRVHYGPHAGHDIEIQGRECKILKEDEVLAAWRLRRPCGCSGWGPCTANHALEASSPDPIPEIQRDPDFPL